MTINAFEAQALGLPTVVGMALLSGEYRRRAMISLHFGGYTETVDGEIRQSAP